MNPRVLALTVAVAGLMAPIGQASNGEGHLGALGPTAGEIERNVVEARSRAKAELIRKGRLVANDFIPRLDCSVRTIDVFGQRVRGSEQLAEAGNAGEEERRKHAAVQAVRSLKIGGVAPERAEAYLGTWTLRAGDTLNLAHEGETFAFVVRAIASDSILFVESETRTEILARINVVPDLQPAEMRSVESQNQPQTIHHP